jgi:hypothetical protein
MSTPAAAAVSTVQANEYQLQDHSGKIKITYYPIAPAPPIKDHTPGPSLSYTGPQGTLSFAGSQIETQDTPLGKMLSVSLSGKTNPGDVTFTLFLPQVIFGEGDSQKFTTVGVTATRPTTLVAVLPKPGGQIHYAFESLHGSAKNVPTPQ